MQDFILFRKARLIFIVGASCFIASFSYPQENQNMAAAAPIDGVSFRFIETNGIRMRIAEAGDSGPLMLLAHGWPESWYNWRHQIAYFAKAGYRVVAPDMRGYGKTDAPEGVEEYDIFKLTEDMVGVLDALNEDTAIMVGHDWGAIVAWHSVLIHPERFSALIAMSVPYGGRPPVSPMVRWRTAFNDNFFYILYHNEDGGVAEAEYDNDPMGIISRLYLSPQSPRQAPTINDPARSAGGWIGRLGAPRGLPNWLTSTDLDYVVKEFEQSGFRGGVNYYRNFQRNWEITEGLANSKIVMPTIFITGEKDSVIAGASEEQLAGSMGRVVDDLRDVVLIPEMGHWIQQEAPDEVNQIMSDFLTEINIVP